MSAFEFLSVLISVVIGLGMANVLTGVGRMIQRHGEITVSATFVAWTLFLFHYMIIYWWTIVFGWQEWQNWNLVIFIFILTYGVILFLLSVILFPTDVPEGWDPHAHFIRMRHWFFGIFFVLIAIEFMDSYLKDHLAQFSTGYLLMLATWLLGGAASWITEKRRIHAISAWAILISQVSWVAYQLRDLEWSLAV